MMKEMPYLLISVSVNSVKRSYSREMINGIAINVRSIGIFTRSWSSIRFLKSLSYKSRDSSQKRVLQTLKNQAFSTLLTLKYVSKKK